MPADTYIRPTNRHATR